MTKTVPLVTTDRPFLVGIAGGGGSGKSWLAQGLAATLGAAHTTLLAHDAYYRDPAPRGSGDGAEVNLDGPEAFDQALFLEDLESLRAGRPVHPPLYCFVTHRRIGRAPLLAPRPVVIVEGTFLLWSPAVRAALDLSIYVDAPESVRLERRLARNVAEGGRTADEVYRQFTTSVRRVHHTYVEPTRAMADLVLSTSGRLEPIVEIATAVVLDRLTRHRHRPLQRAS